MLLVSNAILNSTEEAGENTIHPWIHSFSNVAKADDLLQGISIPDVLPSDMGEHAGRMSVSAGDFVDIYAKDDHKNRYDGQSSTAGC